MVLGRHGVLSAAWMRDTSITTHGESSRRGVDSRMRTASREQGSYLCIDAKAVIFDLLFAMAGRLAVECGDETTRSGHKQDY
jgi:hypothetical protein